MNPAGPQLGMHARLALFADADIRRTVELERLCDPAMEQARDYLVRAAAHAGEGLALPWAIADAPDDALIGTARHSLQVRDVAALVALFVDDVRVADGLRGDARTARVEPVGRVVQPSRQAQSRAATEPWTAAPSAPAAWQAEHCAVKTCSPGALIMGMSAETFWDGKDRAVDRYWRVTEGERKARGP